MIGFVILLAIFLALVVSCFAWGLHEIRHPRDAGPLFINLSRMIVERASPFELRKALQALKAEKEGWKVLLNDEKEAWLKDLRVFSKNWVREDEVIDEVLLVLGNVTVPKETVFNKLLMVWGRFQTGEHCNFEREIYALGDCIIGRDNHLRSITTHRGILLEDSTVVDGYVDSDDKMYIKKGCKIGGLATSQTAVFAEECSFSKVYSPAGLVSVADVGELITVDRSIQRFLTMHTPSSYSH